MTKTGNVDKSKVEGIWKKKTSKKTLPTKGNEWPWMDIDEKVLMQDEEYRAWHEMSDKYEEEERYWRGVKDGTVKRRIEHTEKEIVRKIAQNIQEKKIQKWIKRGQQKTMHEFFKHK